METTILIIGMLLAFIAGAYARMPWGKGILDNKHSVNLGPIDKQVTTKEAVDNYLTEMIRRDNAISEKRRGELMNAWNYNGNPQKEVDERD
jgi:hypothetical protein